MSFLCWASENNFHLNTVEESESEKEEKCRGAVLSPPRIPFWKPCSTGFFLFFDNIDHDDNGRDDHVMIHDDPDYQG